MNNVEDSFYLNNPALPKEGAQFEWTADQLKAIIQCKKDITHFAENYFYIVNLDRGKEIIKLYKAQKRILKSLVKNNRIALLASRQSGKTTMVSIFALWYTCFNDDKTILIVANKEKTATEILSRIRTSYELLPNWLKPAVRDYSKTNVVFANGSRIFVSTTASTAARGSSINCLLIDEAAHIDKFKEDEFFNSVMPVISSSKNSKIFMISTPKGTSNHFYQIYSAAERKENEWTCGRIDWQEVPGRDEDWKRKAIADLGSIEAFEQEYGNKFIETGETAVDKEVIRDWRMNARIANILNTDTYKVWETPNPKAIYVFGVDVGDGAGAAASTIQCFNITDLTHIKQAFTFYSRTMDTAHFALEIHNLAKQWGRPPILVERNNMGGEVANFLVYTHHYDRIVSYDFTEGVTYDKYGIQSSTNSRYEGVSNMRYWINTLKAVEIYDIGTIQEFETFVKFPNGTWHKQPGEGVFDDRVLGALWALFSLHGPIAESLFEIVKYDERGKPLKIQKSYYSDEDFYGLNVSEKAWTEEDFVPAFMSVKRGSFGSGVGNPNDPTIEEMMTDGWTTV